MISAVFWDFGGVVLSSPFEAFAAHERSIGVPEGTIRTINATNPDDNAWAKLERSEVDAGGFAELFTAEAAAIGHDIDGHAVLGLLEGDVRPRMVEAIRRCGEQLKIACLTNNVRRTEGGGSGIASSKPERAAQVAEVMAMFDEVVESSVVGCRKPEPRFYEIACERVGVEPSEVVFLDDLGINLKPARAMGMTTIKVIDPDEALEELQSVVGFPLG